MAFLELDNEGDGNRVTLDDGKVTCLIEKDGELSTRVQGDMPTEFKNKSRAADFESTQAALWRAGRGWVLIDYTGYRTLVNGLRVADCKWIHEGDVIQIGESTAKLFEIDREKVKDDSELLDSDKICYICRDEYESGEQVAYCPKCGAPHHVDCWLFGQEGSDKEVYEVGCANCGTLYQLDRRLHPLEDEGDKADEDEMIECPHCNKLHSVNRKAQPVEEEVSLV